MSTQQIAAMIAGFGLPYAYDHFSPTAEHPMPAPPFVCFSYPNSDDFYADDRNYQIIHAVSIELYTNNKDFALEARIESALTANELPWIKEETYLGGEKLYMVTWECSAVITTNDTSQSASG